MCVRFELYNTPKIVKFLKGVKYTLDKPKDIRPGDSAPVIAMDKNLKPRVFVMKWGYNLNGKLVFNSRNEDIINRKMFKQDFISHRLAIPATSYYRNKLSMGNYGEDCPMECISNYTVSMLEICDNLKWVTVYKLITSILNTTNAENL